MVCAWAAPRRISWGWRACHGVNAHCRRFMCERRTRWRRCVHNAGHLAHEAPLSAFVTEVVCDLGAAPSRGATSLPRTVTSLPRGAASLPRTAASLTASGGSCAVRGPVRDLPAGDIATKRGNCTIRGATRRRHAEGRLLMLQNPPSSPGCGGVAVVNCVLESPASQNIWAITPMLAIVRRGGLHCGRV